MNKLFFIVLVFFCLQGCSREASHLPTILSLPKALVTTTIENSIYNARRNKVKEYVVANYDALKTEVRKGQGVHLDELLLVSDVVNKNQVKKQLQRDYVTMFENIDLMTESIMQKFTSIYVHESQEKLKTINDFSYTQASNIIKFYLKENLEVFRSAVKNGDPAIIKKLADELNIQKVDHREIFSDYILEKYNNYFIEPVVVGVMVSI